jgi:hypothetical protein
VEVLELMIMASLVSQEANVKRLVYLEVLESLHYFGVLPQTAPVVTPFSAY